jgi:hypothetical protein
MTLIALDYGQNELSTAAAAHRRINIRCTWDTTLGAISRNPIHHRFSSLVYPTVQTVHAPITRDSFLLDVSIPTGAKKGTIDTTSYNSLKRWEVMNPPHQSSPDTGIMDGNVSLSHPGVSTERREGVRVSPHFRPPSPNPAPPCRPTLPTTPRPGLDLRRLTNSPPPSLR